MFRYALKCLLERKMLYILIIIQFIIAFSSIFAFIIGSDNVTKYIKDVKSIFKSPEETVLLQGQSFEDIGAVWDKGVDNYNKFLEYMYDNDNVEGYISYKTEINIIDLSTEDNEKSKIIKEKLARYYMNNSKVPALDTLYIDGRYENIINISVSEGRMFKKDDFYKENGEIIPVILGNGLKGIYNLGDIISINIDTKIEVIGFLEDKFNFCINGIEDNILADLTSYEYGAIAPITKRLVDDPAVAYFRIQQGFFYKLKENINRDYVINEIDFMAKSLGIDIDSKMINDVLGKMEQERRVEQRESLYLGIIILVFTLASLIISTLALINSRKREFGILISTGGSIKSIVRLVIIELGIVLVISFLLYQLGTLRYRLQYITGDYILARGQVSNIYYATNNIAFTTHLKVLLMIFLFLVIISIIPTLKIIKLEPKDLIGGVE